MAAGDTIPAVGGSTVFKENNNPTTTAIWNNYDTCGSMTRADVGLAESGDLDAIFTDSGGTNTMGNFDRYRDMESLLVTQLELKACGGRQYGMYDWLMSGAKSMGKGITKRNVAGGASEIEPFILAAQKDVIKDDYWLVDKIMNHTFDYETSASTSSLNVTLGTISGISPVSGQLIIRVKPQGNNPAAAGYFKKGLTINLFTKTAPASAGYRLQFKVDEAVAHTIASVDYVDVVVDYQSGWGAGADVTSGAMVFGNATILSKIGANDVGGSGVVVIGANNVNDFESWCENRPALNTLKHVPFWYQTSRSSLCVSEFYKEWLERMLRTNAFFNKFGDVSLAERNAQLGLMHQKEWVNSFFWGQPIGPKQKLSTYKELETINSVDSSVFAAGSDIESSAIGYRANALGVYRQLADCDRVKNKLGAALDLSEFLETDIFNLVRSRKDQGKPADSIDVFTDSKTAKNIFNAMMVYYKGESASTLNVNYDITNKNISNLGFYANSYKLHYPAGVTLNVITNEFFDDMVTAHKAGDLVDGTDAVGGITDGSMGRFLMVLDLGGGIYPGIIGSNRVVHKTGDLADLAKVDPSYACVMANPTKETTLNSTTWTAIVECPTDNLIIENFADTTIDP
jgi:hypothetical protein